MRPIVCFLLALVTIANSTPLTRDKRSAGTFAMAGGGFPFGVGSGAFAGAGWPMGFINPWDFSRSFVPVPMPYPMFPMPMKPWYEGENVCTTTKEIDDVKELNEWFSEVSSPNVDYEHESEQCRGTGSKYVCFKRYVNNGVSKMQLTKYECCHGFVRNGAGCVESSAQAGQTPAARRNPQEAYYFYPVQSSTSSSRSGTGGISGASAVGAVAAQ